MSQITTIILTVRVNDELEGEAINVAFRAADFINESMLFEDGTDRGVRTSVFIGNEWSGP